MRKPWTVLISISLAIFFGASISKNSWIFSVLEIGGNLFIQALTLVVVPLVMASIITGVARIASESEFGKIGAKTFGYFVLINLIAILIGVAIGNLAHPGLSIQWSGTPIPPLPSQTNESLVNFFLDIIPSNILDAFAKGKMLGLIFFSILFGYALTHTSKTSFEVHKRFWKGIFEAMIKITHAIMFFLPFGVFCLVAKVFAEMGLETLRPLVHLIWASILALSIFAFGAIPLILKLFGKISIIPYFKAISPALITAFSTSSSSATLPITLECMEERAGISNRICSLVIPLGTSINLAATALYNTMGALFIAQVFRIPMPLTSQILLILVSLFVSFGVASVPGGGLIAVLTLLKTMGLPLEGLGLFLALDRLLDMFRTSANVCSYTASVVLVAKSAGEETALVKKKNKVQPRV